MPDIPLKGQTTELIYLLQWEACNITGSNDPSNSSKGVVVDCWVLGVGKQVMQSLQQKSRYWQQVAAVRRSILHHKHLVPEGYSTCTSR